MTTEDMGIEGLRGNLATATSAASRVEGDPSRAELLEVQDLHVRFRLAHGFLSKAKADVDAVDGVTFSVERGRTLGLVGGTGSGKSTVAHAIMGMVPPTSGAVTIADHDVARAKGRERRDLQRLVQVVLQDPYASLNPRMRIRDIIAEPLVHGIGIGFGRWSTKSAIDGRVEELLGLVGLRPEKANLYPHQFSGGQRQRIAIARALAPKPDLIVLDEPTSALDVSVRAQILNLLKALQDQLGVTYLVISHDLVTVAYLASSVAVMYLGRIVEIGPTTSLYRSPYHPHTVELLASVPGSTSGAAAQLLRSPTAAVDTGRGCRYANRCVLRERLGDPERCVTEDPTLVRVADGQESACHFTGDVRSLAESVGMGVAPAQIVA